MRWGCGRLSVEELHVLNRSTDGEDLDEETLQELLLLFDSDANGPTHPPCHARRNELACSDSPWLGQG